METSFMYHCLGIREQECTRTRYEGGKTILEIRTREDKLYCPKCKSRHVIKSGSTIHDFPITNGKLEGINNKIKTMKRQAYGYRDMPFFNLKLLSLHDSSYPFSG